MDQQTVYDLIQFRQQHGGRSRTTRTTTCRTNQGLNGCSTVIPTYLCPSVAGSTDPSRNPETNQLQYFRALRRRRIVYQGQCEYWSARGSHRIQPIGFGCSDYGGIEGPSTGTTGVVNLSTNQMYVLPANGINLGMLPKLTKGSRGPSHRRPFRRDG